MPLRIADDDPNLNPGETDYNRKFNGLNKAEEAGTFDGSQNINDSDNPNIDKVKDAEDNPNSGWKNNVSGEKPTPIPSGRFSFIKKKGPLATIIITLVGGGFGIAGLLSPALLAQSLLANLVQKFNIQETSLTLRTNKLIASKLSGNVTSGDCQITMILCRFSKPSSKFLTKLEENGIKAFSKNGEVIEAKSILNPFPNTRPASYEFTDGAGNKIAATAEDLSAKLTNNAEFRAAFHSASNSRFMSLADSVFKSIESKFKFNLADKLKRTQNEDDIGQAVGNELDDGASAATTAMAEESGKLAETESKALLEGEANKTVSKLKSAGRGSLINLAAGGLCLLADTPTLITKAVRSFQMAQLIKYSMVFLSAFGSIKAGDATPAEASAIGDQLTKIGSNGKSAMDSFGVNYAVNNAIKPSSDNYKKFTPGGTVSSSLSKYNKIVSSDVKTTACETMANPLTGEAINVALTDSTLIGGVINIAVGWRISEVAAVILPPVIKTIIGAIPTKDILAFFVGDITKSLSGESVGDALTSGASHVMGQTANAGGNMPLTPTEAVAYDNATKQVQLAYAEEDRATLSPFDTSSPNTMLGSIVQKIIPYYISAGSTVGSLTHSLSFISNLVTGSFSKILQPITANAESTDISQYSLCDDPAIKDSGMAAGPYCNIIYGVPTKYLNKDPTTVINELTSSGDIDPVTGEAKTDSKLEAWKVLCTDGSTDTLRSCGITDETANYALYTIDSRIQKSMDGTDTTMSTNS
jgi:hypothetical protein